LKFWVEADLSMLLHCNHVPLFVDGWRKLI